MKRRSARRILLIAGIIVVTGSLSVFAFFELRIQIKLFRDEQSYQSAQHELADKRPDKAIEIIRNRDRNLSGARKNDWIDLEINTLEKLGNTNRLRYLFDQNPSAFSNHETASLLVGRSMLQTNNRAALAKLQNMWKRDRKIHAAWFALEVDALIAEGKANEALSLLKSQSFEGEADASRLMRLALLNSKKNLRDGLIYLDRAYSLAPKNPDVRSFRAQILESAGRYSMARVEYVAAHLAEPNNPLYRDQLAEFYRRNGNLGLAMETWSTSLDEHSPDFIRLKALFWGKAGYPVKIVKIKESDISGDLHPFVGYLQELPASRFWDDTAFQKISDQQTFLDKRQEAFWLRLLQALKDGDEKKAYTLLQSRVFMNNSWNPDIRNGLEKILAVRLGYKPSLPDDPLLGDAKTARQRHQLFGQLDEMSKTGVITPELGTLLRSKEAFAAVFMAGGWVEAALQLHSTPVMPDNFPDWMAYGLTQSIRFNRDNKAALAFAVKQKPTPVMALLTAELEIAEGNSTAGLAKLDALAGKDSDIGFRAAWLLALARMDQRNIKGTREILMRQPRLRNSLTGKEIEARMALSEGDTDKAKRLYMAIEKESTEAMAWLAKKAYKDKDWKTARILTEELIKNMPDRMELRTNLKVIAAAEGVK